MDRKRFRLVKVRYPFIFIPVVPFFALLSDVAPFYHASYTTPFYPLLSHIIPFCPELSHASNCLMTWLCWEFICYPTLSYFIPQSPYWSSQFIHQCYPFLPYCHQVNYFFLLASSSTPARLSCLFFSSPSLLAFRPIPPCVARPLTWSAEVSRFGNHIWMCQRSWWHFWSYVQTTRVISRPSQRGYRCPLLQIHKGLPGMLWRWSLRLVHWPL